MNPLVSGVIICSDDSALMRALLALLAIAPCSPIPIPLFCEAAAARCVSECAEELRDIVGLLTRPDSEVIDPVECSDASELDEMLRGIGCTSGICAPLFIFVFMLIPMGTPAGGAMATGTGMPIPVGSPISNLTWSAGWIFFLRPRFPRGCGFVCILLCLVSSSLRLKRLVQPGKSHAWGFSPVCVRMCLVWCSRRWNALPHTGQMCGRGASFLGGVVDMVVCVVVVVCLCCARCTTLHSAFLKCYRYALGYA